MKRTIEFRGLRVDGKGWVYGYLIQDAISASKTARIVSLRVDGFENDTWLTEDNNLVIPSSVGQFTGLVDKNGVEIYEGDKLKSSSGVINIVVFENGTWGIKDRLDKIGGLNPFSNMNLLYWEIIGNIHETPAP